MLLLPGGIHPNPGLSTFSTISSSNDLSPASFAAFNFSNLSNHLAFVRYNVQSIISKLNLLVSKFLEYDILAFSETWLNPTISIDDLYMQSRSLSVLLNANMESVIVMAGFHIYVKESLYH